MKKRVMTNTEYLLRNVRESEKLPVWNDEFSKLRSSVMKDISKAATEEKDGPEHDDNMEL